MQGRGSFLRGDDTPPSGDCRCHDRAGFSEGDIYSLRLALQEAILNANKHGHQGDWSRPIQVRYFVSPAGVLAEIEDQGPGFEPSQVPDPLARETLRAFADHGRVGELLPPDGGNCEEVLDRFRRAGIGIDALAAQLQREGAEAFDKSWGDLLECIASKSEALRKAG